MRGEERGADIKKEGVKKEVVKEKGLQMNEERRMGAFDKTGDDGQRREGRRGQGREAEIKDEEREKGTSNGKRKEKGN